MRSPKQHLKMQNSCRSFIYCLIKILQLMNHSSLCTDSPAVQIHLAVCRKERASNRFRSLLAVALTLLIVSVNVYSQEKRPLELTDIMQFRQIGSPAISDNGSWVVHAAVPDRGDPDVLVCSTDGKTSFTIPLADKPLISPDEQWVAAVRPVPAEEQEKSGNATGNVGGNGKESGPKPGMALLNLSTGEQSEYKNIKSFSFSNNGKWLFYHSFPEKPEKAGSEKKVEPGTDLHLLSLATGEVFTHPYVTGFAADSLSEHVAMVVKDSSGTGNGVYIARLSAISNAAVPVFADSGSWAANLEWNSRSGSLAFLAGDSEEEKRLNAQLCLWQPGDEAAALQRCDPPEGWLIHHTNKLQWSKDGRRLFLGIKPETEIVEEEKRDSVADLYDAEAILDGRTVDVWHWDDPYINPHQKKRWKEEKDRVYTGVFYPDRERFVALADQEMPGITVGESNRYVVGYSNVRYAKRVTWDGRYNDYYLVDLATGDRRLVLQEQEHGVSLSPDGRKMVYFRNGDWHLVDTERPGAVNLTAELGVPFVNEDWDYPAETPGYGVAGWIDNSDAVWIYDKFDIWAFGTADGEAECVTAGEGRSRKMQFRIRQLDPGKKIFETGETLLLSGYHDLEKYTAVYSLQVGRSGVKKLAEEPAKYTIRAKAKNAEKILFTRESYTEFPDLWTTDMKFRKPRQLSELGLQTEPFAWGNAELVEWLSLDGEPVQGILITPDNADPDSAVPGKRYPVLVYYYRFFTDRMYNFPDVVANHRPCYPYYAGNDYAIFLPDIRFDIGTPGYSATKHLVPGVQKLIDMGIADPGAIGLHGHSWSGYQTAHVITQTDLFACAIAGAPVSNMTSAYSGIRWGTGLARQFQYEKSQSRIGGSLWEMRDRYIENSPVFFADRINTPLLIQFGDEDDAVPWYQGIELYLAMRRLEKDCIFLQYRGEPHHLKKYSNKLDYTIRFKEYLDHYLKGAEPADWIKEGVPYTGN
jgi:dipeptidyl aminopeptidase/acylaminoacyl peptidase